MGPASFNAPPSYPEAPFRENPALGEFTPPTTAGPTRENPLDIFMQQGRNAVAAEEFALIRIHSTWHALCVITSINGATFAGTGQATLLEGQEDFNAPTERARAAAYKAAFSQLQQAENYCLRDKIAFLVRSGVMQAPQKAEVPAAPVKTKLETLKEAVTKAEAEEAEAHEIHSRGDLSLNALRAATERRVCAQEAVEREEWKLEQQKKTAEEAEDPRITEKLAAAEVAHLSARAAEELKAEVLAEDFLKQRESLAPEVGAYGKKLPTVWDEPGKFPV